MSDNIFNTENGDTLIVTLNESITYTEILELESSLQQTFKGQNLKILVIQNNINFDLIKSSNLEDNTDLNLRENNPALQDAWEQYQMVKNLSEGNTNET